MTATWRRYAAVERTSSIGRQLGQQGSTGAIEGSLVEHVASQHGFGAERAHHRRGDTAKRQPDVGDPAGLHEGGAGKAHLRNRLGAPRPYLAVVLMPAAPARQPHGRNQLVGREVHLLVAGVKPFVRHGAAGRGPM